MGRPGNTGTRRGVEMRRKSQSDVAVVPDCLLVVQDGETAAGDKQGRRRTTTAQATARAAQDRALALGYVRSIQHPATSSWAQVSQGIKYEVCEQLTLV